MTDHTYRTVEQLVTQMQDLATRFSRVCTLVTYAPQSGRSQTWQDRPLHSLRIQGNAADRNAVLLVAGQHGYELPGPEALLDFITKLLEAYQAHSDLTYPAFTAANPDFNNISVQFGEYVIRASDIRSYIDDVHLYVVPLANPDGRAAVLGGTTEWRKNMRPRPDGVNCPPHTLQPGESPEIYGEQGAGVDLNRNYDIGWGDLFYAQAWSQDRMAASGDPCSDLYRGPSAGSEPETAHIQSLIQQIKPRFVLDIHTGEAGTSVTYPWGLAAVQFDNQSSSFRNRSLDRASASDTTGGRPLSYREWLPEDEENQLLRIAVALRDQILSAANHDQARAYFEGSSGGQPAVDVQQMTFARGSRAQANPGTLQDYAYSRHFFNFTTEWPAYSFTLECGFTEFGHIAPRDDNHYKMMERVIASCAHGMLATGAQKCVVASAAYGTSDHPAIEFVRHLRERELRVTSSGARFLSAVEPLYYRVGTPVARLIERSPAARVILRNVVVSPVLQLIRGLWGLSQPASTRQARVQRFLWLLGATALLAAAGVAMLLCQL